MKVRYAIELGFGDDSPGTVHLTLVDVNDENIQGPLECPTEAEAKRLASQSADGEPLKWKPAPEAWQPDTYLVSNYYEDEGWDQ